jgi:hypothetical protein
MKANEPSKGGRMKIAVAVVVGAVLLIGAALGVVFLRPPSQSAVAVQELAEPLNEAHTSSLDFDLAQGNLAIDRLTGGEPLLVGGTLEYYENGGMPARSLSSMGGQATLALSVGSDPSPRWRLPWEACNAENDWQLHLNPAVVYEIAARTGGGNLDLDLSGLRVTRLTAETGGGNAQIRLPNGAVNLSVAVKTGAGKIVVEVGAGTKGRNGLTVENGAGSVDIRVPAGLAVRLIATSGLGKVVADPSLVQTDEGTYQSGDYDVNENRITIHVSNGAGTVSVVTKK